MNTSLFHPPRQRQRRSVPSILFILLSPDQFHLDFQIEFDLTVVVSSTEPRGRSSNPRCSSSSCSNNSSSGVHRCGAESPPRVGGHVHPNSPSRERRQSIGEERERCGVVQDVSIQTSLIIAESSTRSSEEARPVVSSSSVSGLPPRQTKVETHSTPIRRSMDVDDDHRRRSLPRPSSHDVRCSMESSFTEVTSIQHFDQHHDDDAEEDDDDEDFAADEILLLLQSKRDELFRQLQ